MKNYKEILSDEEKKALVDLIHVAEQETSCEIKVHLNDNCKGDVLQKACELLNSLGLVKTKARNGIILYLAVKDRKYAIAGDEGILARVPNDFWTETNQESIAFFKKEQYFEGLQHSILQITKTVKTDFPVEAEDHNEISNDISYE